MYTLTYKAHLHNKDHLHKYITQTSCLTKYIITVSEEEVELETYTTSSLYFGPAITNFAPKVATVAGQNRTTLSLRRLNGPSDVDSGKTMDWNRE